MKVKDFSYSFNDVFLENCASVSGPLEKKGPLGNFFDRSYKTLRLNKKSFEQAEIKMQKDVLDILLSKNLDIKDDIDIIFAGDLINQDAISNYSLRNILRPTCSLYAACANSCLTMILSSIFVDSKNAKKAVAITSSHNLTSERQFRNPIEYAGPKANTTTFTVSGACAFLISDNKSSVKITKATMGSVIDVGFKNVYDMGRAMAPSACETLINHFNDFNTTPSDYDLIVTGDLGYYGAKIVHDVLEKRYGTIKNYNDCGLMIFDRFNQDVFAGGSGCACSGLVASSYIYDQIKKGIYKKVLICATGALINSDMSLQKESMPCISHAILWEGCL